MTNVPIRNAKPRVLIVGAGPTGLMMASQLSRFAFASALLKKPMVRPLNLVH